MKRPPLLFVFINDNNLGAELKVFSEEFINEASLFLFAAKFNLETSVESLRSSLQNQTLLFT